MYPREDEICHRTECDHYDERYPNNCDAMFHVGNCEKAIVESSLQRLWKIIKSIFT